ncbi:MAG: helix-turn-helix transcriptional regulator [Thiohalorhabdaceae bacterium]
MQVFSERLKQAREEAGLSHAALASLIGAGGRQQIAGWEAGGQPRDIAMIPKLCDALGVTADWLFGMEKQDKASMAGLSARHIEAAKGIAGLPRPVQETVFDLIDQMRPLRRDGLIGQILSYDTHTKSHESLMRTIEEYQRQYRRERSR